MNEPVREYIVNGRRDGKNCGKHPQKDSSTYEDVVDNVKAKGRTAMFLSRIALHRNCKS